MCICLHLLDDSGAMSISSVLPVLSKMMDGLKAKNGTLLLSCLSLEKETTGALVLARREEVLEHLLNLQRSNQVQRKYWYIIAINVHQNRDETSCSVIPKCHVLCRVVTVGVPVPSEGVIDIPIMEREVTGAKPHYKVSTLHLELVISNSDSFFFLFLNDI